MRNPQTFLCIKKKVHRKQFGDVPNNTMFFVKSFFQTKQSTNSNRYIRKCGKYREEAMENKFF